MHLYRNSIVIFGIAIPTVLIAALVGVSFIVKGRLATSFENKMSNFKTFEKGQKAGQAIEKEVTLQRKHLERWDSLVRQDTASSVTSQLREISEQLPSKEIQQTAFERSGAKGGLSGTAAQNSSQIKIAFRGTYRTMQKAFLELETRMPQLQLEDLKIDPSNNLTSLLNFQVTYTAWEK
jgi:hypothetical protein